MKYRCVDECVPKHIAHELEKRYQNYLSAKPPTIHQVLDNQDEEVKHMTPPQNSEVKPPVPVPVPLVDYESDIEI